MLSNGSCKHDVFIAGLCGVCGIKLDSPQSSSFSMVHSVPGLKVSKDYAESLGKDDQVRLTFEKKLVLLVDLDQTLLHTTHEKVDENDLNIHSFRLWAGHPVYHTKLRPHLNEFLRRVSNLYELHIFTFGCRKYAHKIASIIDPTHRYFGNRILSRDESVDQFCKQGNLNNLFPCGDSMVCIIDDRADVWRDPKGKECENLIQVKPYLYFKTSISDGAARSSAEKDLEADECELKALLTASGFLNSDEESSESETEAEENKKPQETSDKSNDCDTCEAVSEESTNEFEASQEDDDDYLEKLIPILEKIHGKWYERFFREFEKDGQSCKLPNISEFIHRYRKELYEQYKNKY